MQYIQSLQPPDSFCYLLNNDIRCRLIVWLSVYRQPMQTSVLAVLKDQMVFNFAAVELVYYFLNAKAAYYAFTQAASFLYYSLLPSKVSSKAHVFVKLCCLCYNLNFPRTAICISSCHNSLVYFVLSALVVKTC